MGNLDSVRDWGHAKDYVKAMYLMLQQETPEDFVIATNDTHTVREFIDRCFYLRGINLTWRNSGEEGVDENGIVRIKTNPKYFRPVDVDFLKGNPKKAELILKWKPEISFDELVTEMVDSDATIE